MANLAFQAILATGHREMVNFKVLRNKRYMTCSSRISICPVCRSSCSRGLAAKNVDYEKNFITINAPLKL